MKLIKLYVNDQAKDVVLPIVMGHAANKLHIYIYIYINKSYIYKDECLYVCLFVSLYLIQIHISEPIGTKLCTRLPRGLEETVGYVWTRYS